MVNYYMLAILFGLALYIILFDNSRWKEKRSLSSKGKFIKVYIVTWIILYLVYLVCILATPSTRPFFKEHIVFGAFLHLFFAVFAWKATIYY